MLWRESMLVRYQGVSEVSAGCVCVDMYSVCALCLSTLATFTSILMKHVSCHLHINSDETCV